MHQTRALLNKARDQFAGISETPRLDAEILLAHALDVSRSSLLAMETVSQIPEEYSAFITRRAKGEPIAYILGEWEFFSLPFFIDPPVLVPRPETEHLVEAVLEYCDTPKMILDIGTGSGCIMVTLLKQLPESRGIATDLKDGNLKLAQRNAKRHDVDTRVEFRQGDLFQPILRTASPFDVICSNPPYVALTDKDSLDVTVKDFEDSAALFSGEDGLDVIRRLVNDAVDFLRPDGWLVFEFGIRQDSVIEHLLTQRGYRDIHIIPDLAGIPRIALGRNPAC
jgi:release factor glutamine methyltransferase